MQTMKSILAVNPFECRMWDLHDRLDAHVTERTCKAEIESFARDGQLVPVLGRRLINDPTHKIELIYGARRLFVARHLNKPLLVEICTLSDKDSIVAMDIENRQRKDICPYERGASYAKWLRSGPFSSQDDIARALKVSASQISRLLRIAHLPAVIVEAFESAEDICEGWGLELMEALEDEQKRQRTISTARLICKQSPRPSAREVYRQLLAASASGRRVASARHEEVVKNKEGSPLFRISYRNSSIALLVPVSRVSAQSLMRIREAVAEILQ
jgi:ParB family chromosome partitioning protein